MLNIKYIRENIEVVKENLQKKFKEDRLPLVEEIVSLDEKYRGLIKETNDLKHKRNKITEEISIKKTKKENFTKLIEQAKELPTQIKELDKKKEELFLKIKEIEERLPTIISKETPVGKDESENKEIKRFSEPKKYDYELKGHTELAEELNLVDFDAARNVSGKGFFYLKGDLALLNQALIRYAQDYLYEKGFVCVATPLMINRDACNVVSYEDFKESIFKIENKDLHLVASSELSLVNMFKDKIIEDQQLPIRMFSFSPCFRQEIGSHGVDERGLFRVHQFDKVEQVVICKPEDAQQRYKEILNNQTEMLLSLGFTLRHLEICSGDLGDMKERMIDLEVWGPKRKGWIELGSCSHLNNSQSLKLNIKAKDKEEKYYPYTLNNTGLSTTRTIVAILENFQTKEGTIKIPEVLQKYMFGKKEIKKNNLF
jgi:seryl-tRNA synthetase